MSRLTVSWLGLIATAVVPAVTTAAATDLYEVTISNQQDAAALRQAHVDPLLRIRGGYLVLADDAGEARLARSGLFCSMVAKDVYRDGIALDTRTDDSDFTLYPMIYDRHGVRLFRVDVARLPSWSDQHRLASIPPWPVPIIDKPPQQKNTRQAHLEFDLDSVVALVRQDSLESYSAQLETFGYRVAGSSSSFYARNWLLSRFDEFGYDSVTSNEFAAEVYGEIETCHNVVACKTGSELPRHQIIIGAHRDAVPGSPGADDNGSGTVAVLELARVIAGLDTRMSIVFILFDAEEPPPYLQGSWHYARGAFGRGDSIYFMVNMDMIGHYENEGDIRLFHDASDNTYQSVYASLADTLEGMNLAAHCYDYPLGWDDWPFYQQGYGVLGLHEYVFSTVYHTAHDSTVYLNSEYMARVIRTLLGTVLVCDAAYVAAPMLFIDHDISETPILYPDRDTVLSATIVEYAGEQMVPASALMHYSVNGDQYNTTALVAVGGGVYQAAVPPLSCYSNLEYYFSAEGLHSGLTFYTDTSRPFTRVVATNEVVTFSDNFELDLGWTVDSQAQQGNWIRGVPSGSLGAPYGDYDGSGRCYHTGVGPGIDVGEGRTVLYSPVLNLAVGAARLEYVLWYDNAYLEEEPDDVFQLYLSPNGGSSWGLIEELGPDGYADGSWETREFWIQDVAPGATSIQVRFVASDFGQNSQVEAAVDAFSLVEFSCDPLILTETIPDATLDEPFSQQLVAVGGEGDLVWSDQFDDLVGTGLSLTAAGVLLGTPSVSGEMSFTARAEDSLGAYDTQPLSLTVEAGFICGDIDNNGEGPDISDLVYLVDYMFTGGPPPPVMATADVDGSGGDPDIADLVYLVDFMFTDGPAPTCD